MDKGSEFSYIGLFNDSFMPVMDGVTLTVAKYAAWLHENSMNPCVVTPSSPQMPGEPFPIMSYFSLPIASRHPYRYGYPRLDLTIRRRLRRTPFSIIHSHSPFSAGRLAIYTARRQQVPLIGTFHSKYRTDLEHSLRRFPWLVDRVMKRIVSFYEACDQVWIPQAAVEQTVREYGFRGRVEVVENGNDLAHIPASSLPQMKLRARQELGIAPGKLCLLFVGQHIWEKGIGVILDALKLLRRENQDFSMHFIGTGYAASELAERVREAGLSEQVSLHGVINDRGRLAFFYAAADLFLFPSFYDNAPLVVREAAALGTPSILPEGSTAAEVISDGSNGFLCPRSAESYAETIMRCAPLAPEAGLRARATLVRSWQDVMSEVSARYSDLINHYRP